ncbi:hypothetical protein Emtol_0067 (plasmid) [Emticicia oligotrophica DSM 17448]|uniref:Uncharacterized protein n=1 Tax=Emticicia oligotrophica (strain DSM 17448 / CIP 109782 / MTCC 6937 / GPTSA100-15) TaxID=929562 RepID=A0ABN4AXC7_EMTOG|nr:hypothetical protein [Emticicia oligotrophica]AFK05697.1 hypothetical protein Emtol_0067 [Emticicia oligotrophica DSM 17448]
MKKEQDRYKYLGNDKAYFQNLIESSTLVSGEKGELVDYKKFIFVL